MTNEQPTSRNDPFFLCRGPRDSKVFILGEAPGENEDILRKPFVGSAGTILNDVLALTTLPEPFITNVLNLRPPGGNIEAFMISRRDLPADYALPEIRRGKFLHPDFIPQLARLQAELDYVQPNLIIGMGNTALWALQSEYHIMRARGVMFLPNPAAPIKTNAKQIFTHHPAAVIRDFSLYVVLARDFQKAAKYTNNAPLCFTARKLLINPTIEEVETLPALFSKVEEFSIDIETKNGQITCIGFGTPTTAVSIPFYGSAKINYWDTEELELRAWQIVRELCAMPQPKIFQNGLYDMQYLLYCYGIRVRNPCFDTMLMHHAQQPELKKDLGFLGSLYLDEPSWKDIRFKAKSAFGEEKKDE
jgi:uracil-DNA glycosylase